MHTAMIHNLDGRHRSRAFTLIEVLVVVSIIALLIAILLPSLKRARAQAREVKCAANLSQFGKGFYAYAAEFKGYLCSGSFDPEMAQNESQSDKDRDGPVDRIGWVADLVNRQCGRPAEALCPSNLAQVNQKLGRGTHGWMGTRFRNGDDYRTWELIDQRIKRGYNTNYTQAWYMARSQANGKDFNLKRPFNTLGPLRDRFMLRVNPSVIPIIGDGRIDNETYYEGNLGYNQLTVKTMTDGPYVGLYGPQDYADFGPAHGISKSWYIDESGSSVAIAPHDRANILFADGHVDQFIDKVRNGGFYLTLVEDPDPTKPPRYVQEDVDGRVFDGVLSIGRRTADPEGIVLK